MYPVGAVSLRQRNGLQWKTVKLAPQILSLWPNFYRSADFLYKFNIVKENIL